MAVKQGVEGREPGIGDKKTERVNVWLTPTQIAWLKSKKNLSTTMRALVMEAMNLDLLKESVKQGARRAPREAARPRSLQSRKGGSSRGRGR
jgi:hypothetical protein